MTEESTNPVVADAAQASTAAPASEPPAELNIADLAAMKSIIDVASQRGAFKANEMEAVGKIYNKLDKFLEAVSKKEGQ
jgi:hypothetical protein